MLINEYRPEFQFRESSEDKKFGQGFHLWVPIVMSGTDVQNQLHNIFKMQLYIVSNMQTLKVHSSLVHDHTTKKYKGICKK